MAPFTVSCSSLSPNLYNIPFSKMSTQLCLLSQVSQNPKANMVGDKEEKTQSKKLGRESLGWRHPALSQNPALSLPV